MIFSHSQRQQLRILRSHRDSPPTVLGYFKAGWKSTVIICAACAAAAAVYYWVGWPAFCGFFVGTLFGVIARDAGWYRRLVLTWPMTREIIDWRRVDELIERNP